MAPDAPPPAPENPEPGTPKPKIPGGLQGLRQQLESHRIRQQRFDEQQAKIAKDEAARIAKINEPPKPKKQYKGKKTFRGMTISELPNRKLAVELRVAGLTNRRIAERVGVTESTVAKYIRDYVLSQTAPDDQVAEVRRVMDDRLEHLHEIWWPRAMGRQFDDGSWDVPPSKDAGEMVLKIMERKAKLTGSDQQVNAQTLLISAESIAAYLGWDPSGEKYTAVAEADVIDVLELPPAEPYEEDDDDERA